MHESGIKCKRTNAVPVALEFTKHAFCFFGISYGPCLVNYSHNKTGRKQDARDPRWRKAAYGEKNPREEESLPTLCSAPLSSLMSQQPRVSLTPRRRPKSPRTWHALASPDGLSRTSCTQTESGASCKKDTQIAPHPLGSFCAP